jgi:hypothetical protein
VLWQHQWSFHVSSGSCFHEKADRSEMNGSIKYVLSKAGLVSNFVTDKAPTCLKGLGWLASRSPSTTYMFCAVCIIILRLDFLHCLCLKTHSKNTFRYYSRLLYCNINVSTFTTLRQPTPSRWSRGSLTGSILSRATYAHYLVLKVKKTDWARHPKNDSQFLPQPNITPASIAKVLYSPGKKKL